MGIHFAVYYSKERHNFLLRNGIFPLIERLFFEDKISKFHFSRQSLKGQCIQVLLIIKEKNFYCDIKDTISKYLELFIKRYPSLIRLNVSNEKLFKEFDNNSFIFFYEDEKINFDLSKYQNESREVMINFPIDKFSYTNLRVLSKYSDFNHQIKLLTVIEFFASLSFALPRFKKHMYNNLFLFLSEHIKLENKIKNDIISKSNELYADNKDLFTEYVANTYSKIKKEKSEKHSYLHSWQDFLKRCISMINEHKKSEFQKSWEHQFSFLIVIINIFYDQFSIDKACALTGINIFKSLFMKNDFLL
jgi:hypothetical protein